MVQAFTQRLSPQEQARAARLRVAEDRSRFACTRAVLRHLLGQRLGVAPDAVMFGQTARGKPVLDADRHPGGALHFSVSHAGMWAAIALCGYPVGVDVEQQRELDVAGLSAHVFDTATCARLAREGWPQAAFFQEWTRREAHWKATGAGLAGAGLAQGDSPAPEPRTLCAFDIEPGYYGAVCVLHAPAALKPTDIQLTSCSAADALAQVND